MYVVLYFTWLNRTSRGNLNAYAHNAIIFWLALITQCKYFTFLLRSRKRAQSFEMNTFSERYSVDNMIALEVVEAKPK